MASRATNKDTKKSVHPTGCFISEPSQGEKWATGKSGNEYWAVKKKSPPRSNLASHSSSFEIRPPAPTGRIKRLRERLDLPRKTFARLMSVSERSLASLESGASPSEPVTRRSHELQRLIDALAEVIQLEAIGPWLMKPNDAFDRLKPIEVIERGESDRIWQMIFLLRSGSGF